MVIVAVFTPIDVGVKVTVKVAVPPGAIVDAACETEKSPELS